MCVNTVRADLYVEMLCVIKWWNLQSLIQIYLWDFCLLLKALAARNRCILLKTVCLDNAGYPKLMQNRGYAVSMGWKMITSQIQEVQAWEANYSPLWSWVAPTTKIIAERRGLKKKSPLLFAVNKLMYIPHLFMFYKTSIYNLKAH